MLEITSYVFETLQITETVVFEIIGSVFDKTELKIKTAYLRQTCVVFLARKYMRFERALLVYLNSETEGTNCGRPTTYFFTFLGRNI